MRDLSRCFKANLSYDKVDVLVLQMIGVHFFPIHRTLDDPRRTLNITMKRLFEIDLNGTKIRA